jgi:Zn-dependent protease with chaperone function
MIRHTFLSCLALLVGQEGLAQSVPRPSASPATVSSLNKPLLKELGKGRLIDHIESRGKYPKAAFRPDSTLLKPYASAAVGAPVAYQMVQGTEFADAPAAQALAQQVVHQLLRGWKGPPESISVRIVASPHYHAEATPTGLILVSLGTFSGDPTEGAATVDELALLLGHELSHILLRHMEDQNGMLAIGRVVNVAAGGLLLYSAANRSQMSGRQFDMRGDPKLFRASLISSLATTTILKDLLAPSFDRGKELEADRLGIDLARRAGFVVTEAEAAAFIGRHSADQASQSQRMASLSTLLIALNAEVAARTAGASQGRFGPIFDSALNAVGSKAIGAISTVVAEQTRSHPDPTERAAFSIRYIQQNYSEGARGAGGVLLRRNVRDIGLVASSPGMPLLLQRVRRADEVDRRLTASLADATGADTEKAVAETLRMAGFSTATVATVKKVEGGNTGHGKGQKRQGAVAKSGSASGEPAMAAGFADDRAAYTARIQGMLQQVSGNGIDARVTYRRGLAMPLAPVHLAQQFGQTPHDATNAVELDAVVERYGKALGTSDPLLDLKVASAMAKGDTAAAEVAAARCSSYENGRLYSRCAGYLGYDPTNYATPAKTEEGKKAFIAKPLEKGLQSLKSLKDIF